MNDFDYEIDGSVHQPYEDNDEEYYSFDTIRDSEN